MPERRVNEQRTAQEIGVIIVSIRLQLYNRAVSCGPKAIRQAMDAIHNVRPLPSLRTIARALAQNGLTHGRTGWYKGDDPAWLPESAKRWKPEQL
jgi:hypothetical protein